MGGILIEEKDAWGRREKIMVMKVTGMVLWGENCNVHSVKD